MGTQETDWVAIANNLLSKCHLNHQVRELKHCDARVFVALYEAILGEQVPDFIASSSTPEDDAHNVQSVIDSLALDYLQVSLSHITGENIIQGDLESIRNLLEIFDGLLEYLTEQISEASSQNGDDVDSYKELHGHSGAVLNGHKDVLPSLRPPPSVGSLSSELMVPSWEGTGSESTTELIQLGETAHTLLRGQSSTEFQHSDSFRKIACDDILQQNGEIRIIYWSPLGGKQGFEGIQSIHRGLVMNGYSVDEKPSTTQQGLTPTAIPLKRPYQPKDSRPVTISRDIQVSISSDRSPNGSPSRSREPPVITDGTSASASAEDLLHDKFPKHGHPKTLEKKSPTHIAQGPTAEVCASQFSQKKVAFRTQPDIRFMTLQRTLEEQGDRTPSAGEEELVEPVNREADGRAPLSTERLMEEPPTPSPGYSLLDSRVSGMSLADEPISVQRARNKLSELELQEMSNKLSRRLDELDRMLKKALGEQVGSSELKEEDKLSQHSDSVMEYRRKKKLQASQNHKKPPARPRSLSSSPAPLASPRQSLFTQFEDALHKEATGETGKIRRELQKELDLQRLKAQMLSRAYKDELKVFEQAERTKLSNMKEKLKEKETELKENLIHQPPKKSHPEKVYAGKLSRLLPKPRQWAPSCHKVAGRMKIKEDNLLPLLLEEFPHLQMSPHTFNAMWKGQMAQVEQLIISSQEDERSKHKLQQELEEAHKKHDLLAEIIRREQGQNQRLKDFKERIRLQKSAQNKMRENRQQVARAKKYYEDYHVQLRAKMMRARTREERIFKKLLEEGLEIQKQRLRELRSYTKEQREEQWKRHKDELESMENYYKDQFSMLAEAVTQERQDIQAREKCQSKTLHKMKRDLRMKMEKEIQELQELIIRTDEDAFFRELEAERLKRRLQMASFQHSKSHGL
ncbi:LOW QUALITY PROTEIN: centrosomal protein of 95 kDa [Gastrophryne carolinensis]